MGRSNMATPPLSRDVLLRTDDEGSGKKSSMCKDAEAREEQRRLIVETSPAWHAFCRREGKQKEKEEERQLNTLA
jgi:hypothetical protein